jgi:dihydrofolate synthase/folylpolyglutamate synthase
MTALGFVLAWRSCANAKEAGVMSDAMGRGAAGASPPPGTADWVAYLRSLAAFGMRPGLERVSELLERLGRPQDAFRAIHIVGTNGKSSTTRYCEALLRASGLRSGAYLSPHIFGWNERVLVDGRPVAERLLGECVLAVRAQVAALPDTVGETTQFEVLTVSALLALAESGVEAVALEAGLGGRLDATNVVRTPVVVLTNIALEHTEVLGATRELIFAEKAAVIKGGEVVFGQLDGLEAEACRACSAAGARARFLGVDFAVSGVPHDFAVTLHGMGCAADDAPSVDKGPRGSSSVAGGERWTGLRVPSPALYQVVNAGLAVVAVRLLLGGLDEDAARQALRATVVPGRLQKVSEHPLVLVDGAHNPEGVRALIRSLAALPARRPLVGVLAIMRDKSYAEMLEQFVPLLDDVVCTRANEPRSLTAEEIAAAVRSAAGRVGRPEFEPLVEPDPHRAVHLARELAGPAGSVLVGGSLYLLEDLRDVLESAG